MYGLIFECLEKFIVKKHDAEIWALIKVKSDCTINNGSWVRLQFYPDELFFSLINNASEFLGYDVLLKYGHFFVSDFLPSYDLQNATVCKNRSLREWLNTVNDLHNNFKSRLPNFKSPELYAVDDINDPSGETILLHYYSQRGHAYCTQLVVGIVKEVAKESFDMEITMEQISTQGVDGANCTSFRIRECEESISERADTFQPLSNHGRLPSFNAHPKFNPPVPVVPPALSRVNSTSSMIKRKNSALSLNSTAETEDNTFRRIARVATESTVDVSAPFQANNKDDEDKNNNNGQHTSHRRLTDAPRRRSSGFGSMIQQSFIKNFKKKQSAETCGLSALHMTEVFPFHFVVDKDFIIINQGSKLSFLLEGFDCIGFHIREVFRLRSPKWCDWVWQDIDLNHDCSFEFEFIGNDERIMKHLPTKHVALKGGVYICCPENDPSVEETSAFFLVNPDCLNITEIMSLNLALPDLPRYSCQRDLAILGEHLHSETKISHSLDMLNRELGNSLQLAEAEQRRVRERAAALEVLPIHKAIYENQTEDLIVEAIDASPLTVLEKDYDGFSAFDLCLKSELPKVLRKILLQHLPIDVTNGQPVDPEQHGYCWTKLVQFNKPLYAQIIDEVLDQNINFANELAYVQDSEGRPAFNIASPLCLKKIKENIFFHKRYEIPSMTNPDFWTEISIAYFAIDHGDNGRKVALKFTNDKIKFQRALALRSKADFSDVYVIKFFDTYDATTDLRFKMEQVRKGLEKYPWCYVKSATEKNLKTMIFTDRIAGREWKQIKTIITQVLEAVHHLHTKNIMHGNLRPLSLVRSEGRMKIDECGSSAFFDVDYAGYSISSGFAPPEMFYKNDDLISVKKLLFNSEGLPSVSSLYDFVKAGYHYDIWSIGIIAYELFTGTKIFQHNDDDHMDGDAFEEILSFTDSFKKKKLSRIADLTARNFVSQMLSKDPTKRPSIEQLLNHPFLTGQKVARMVGEDPEFDVFLSYRVDSDLKHVEFLYNVLTEANLKVWFDKKSLVPGVPWEIGFTEGLLKSKFFVPVISRKCVKMFSSLDENSPCDNVLLEWRLALEFQSRGLTEKIYPIFLGECSENSTSSQTIENRIFDSYFRKDSFLHTFPNSLEPKLVVSSVENKLDGHLSRMCLGTAMLQEQSITELLNKMGKSQGHVVQGTLSNAFNIVATDIFKMSSQNGLDSVEEEVVEVQPSKKKISMSSAGTVVRSLFNGPRPTAKAPVALNDIVNPNRISEIMSIINGVGLPRGKERQCAEALALKYSVDEFNNLGTSDVNKIYRVISNIVSKEEAQNIAREIVEKNKIVKKAPKKRVLGIF